MVLIQGRDNLESEGGSRAGRMGIVKIRCSHKSIDPPSHRARSDIWQAHLDG